MMLAIVKALSNPSRSDIQRTVTSKVHVLSEPKRYKGIEDARTTATTGKNDVGLMKFYILGEFTQLLSTLITNKKIPKKFIRNCLSL